MSRFGVSGGRARATLSLMSDLVRTRSVRYILACAHMLRRSRDHKDFPTSCVIPEAVHRLGYLCIIQFRIQIIITTTYMLTYAIGSDKTIRA